ncbi:hypothetical protein MASR2M15_21100 [Anaerolineales bacterium]
MELAIGVALLAIGVLSTFAGNILTKFLLLIWGFIFGFWLCTAFLGTDQLVLICIAGAVGAITAVISFLFLQLGIALIGFLLGLQIGTYLLASMDNAAAQNATGILIGVIFGVVFALLFLKYRYFMIAVATSFAGAAALLAGAFVVFTNLKLFDIVYQPGQSVFDVALLGSTTITVVIYVILALVGMGIQLSLRRL